MKDLYIAHSNQNADGAIIHREGDETRLLHGEPGFEAIVERMSKGTVGFLYTVHRERETGLEFTYLTRGSLELREGDETILLRPGDSYTHHILDRHVMLRVVEDVEYLSINTNPSYDSYEEEHRLLSETLAHLQEIDGDTLDHCIRVKALSMGICYYLDMDWACLTDLYFAASFHDVGKAKIPVEILLKPGKLTAAEYETMKEHSRYTYEMIRESCGEAVAQIAFGHHEKLDGTGYPRGLKGDEISMASRVICVADAYDAMVVTRPYRKGLSREDAMKELRRCQDTQFDGRVVDALEQYLEENM